MVLKKLSVDASTICQLQCPECSTTKGIIKNGIIGSGFLSFKHFKELVTENPAINQIELSNWGEMFLNPEFLKIIRLAYERKIKLTAGNGVNFNSVNDNILETLVIYQFEYLNISIDGASQETYTQYRIKGNFDKVIENIKRLNYYKVKYSSILPKLSWQFIVFGHNEHEIPIVKEYCKELNMVFNPKLNHSDFSPIHDPEFVRVETGLGVANRKEYKLKFKKDYKRPCCQLWYSPQINWDGKLLGCCVNKWVSFGNIFDDKLQYCINSELFRDTMLALKGEIDIHFGMPCYYCPTFSQVIDKPIKDAEIKEYSEFIHPAVRDI